MSQSRHNKRLTFEGLESRQLFATDLAILPDAGMSPVGNPISTAQPAIAVPAASSNADGLLTAQQARDATPIPVKVGDMNGDGVVNTTDLAAFELALSNPAAFVQQHPNVDFNHVGDVNGDGTFNNVDAQAFGGIRGPYDGTEGDEGGGHTSGPGEHTSGLILHTILEKLGVSTPMGIAVHIALDLRDDCGGCTARPDLDQHPLTADDFAAGAESSLRLEERNSSPSNDIEVDANNNWTDKRTGEQGGPNHEGIPNNDVEVDANNNWTDNRTGEHGGPSTPPSNDGAPPSNDGSPPSNDGSPPSNDDGTPGGPPPSDEMPSDETGTGEGPRGHGGGLGGVLGGGDATGGQGWGSNDFGPAGVSVEGGFLGLVGIVGGGDATGGQGWGSSQFGAPRANPGAGRNMGNPEGGSDEGPRGIPGLGSGLGAMSSGGVQGSADDWSCASGKASWVMLSAPVANLATQTLVQAQAIHSANSFVSQTGAAIQMQTALTTVVVVSARF